MTMQNLKLARILAYKACYALTEEPLVWPSFGLVSNKSQGSHHDMNYDLLCASSKSFRNFFIQSSLLGTSSTLNDNDIFSHWFSLYNIAIDNMLIATNKINTHKGAAFLLGLLILSFSRLHKLCNFNKKHINLPQVFTYAKNLAINKITISSKRNYNSESYGQWCYRRYRWRGIRGLIEDNFIMVRNALAQYYALSSYSREIRLGYMRHYFLVNAEDSNLVKRGGFNTALQIQHYAKKLFADGSIITNSNKVIDLEKTMTELNLSAAAAGDLTAVLIFLI